MTLFERLTQQAKANKQRIVLAEGAEKRTLTAAYNQLMMVTMSGRLPDGWTAADAPHTVWTFTDVDGTVHTVALTRYDAMHDAVAIDGVALFYLIQGGFSLGI